MPFPSKCRTYQGTRLIQYYKFSHISIVGNGRDLIVGNGRIDNVGNGRIDNVGNGRVLIIGNGRDRSLHKTIFQISQQISKSFSKNHFQNICICKK